MSLIGPSLSRQVDLTDLLSPAVLDRPDEIALVSAESSWTWRELDRDISRLAAHLLGMGLRPGDRVASLMPNRDVLLVHYLACLKAGLVVTPLNYRYTAAEIDYALGVSGASILFAHAERAEDIGADTLASKLPLGLISYGGHIGQSPQVEHLIGGEGPDVVLAAPDANAPAFVFFTSGSTGKPKGVTHSLNSFGCVVGGFAQAMGLTERDVVLPGASMSHVAALSIALSALSAGARVVVARSFDGDELLPLFRDNRPSVLVMLPAALIAMQREHNATREDFGSIRLCITGGDKFPVNLEREFGDLTGLAINEVYGLTESPHCLFSRPTEAVKAGSVGMVSPGYEASLRDQDGREVSSEADGTLWVKGTPIMLGYWDNPSATSDAVRDGWLDTGDVMRVDVDGYFWFRGRRKQIIVHDGSNITPQEIEEAVMGNPAVAMAGVVGVHDEVHGENVWAYVTLKDGVDRPTSQSIIQSAREKVGYKAPEVVMVVDEIPLNATGKVDRVTLKKWTVERVSPENPN